jgi:membrane protease YdiL (CAAX protease family)
MLIAAGGVLVINHLALAAGGHLFAASCIDAVVVVLLLHLGVVYEHRTRGRDLTITRAFGALALVAAVPVAAAALPLRHISEAVGTLIVALLVTAASFYFASRHKIGFQLLMTRTDASMRATKVVVAAAIGFGLCAYLVRAPTLDTHGVGPTIVGLIALMLAAAGEEFLFRGVVQASLAQIFGAAGVVLASLLSAALFTTVGWWLIPIVCASLSFGLLVATTGALGPAIVAHIGFLLGATAVWPALFRYWRPPLPVSVPVEILLCGGLLVAVAAVTLTEERRRV